MYISHNRSWIIGRQDTACREPLSLSLAVRWREEAHLPGVSIPVAYCRAAQCVRSTCATLAVSESALCASDCMSRPAGRFDFDRRFLQLDKRPEFPQPAMGDQLNPYSVRNDLRADFIDSRMVNVQEAPRVSIGSPQDPEWSKAKPQSSADSFCLA